MNFSGLRLVVLPFLIATVFLIPQQAGAKIDPDSIEGLWLFDEGKGNEAKDSSGHNYHGDLKGDLKWVDGKFDKALEFHGADYVELRNSAVNLPFGAANPFSITAWVKNQGGGTVIGKFNGGIIGAYIVVVSGGGTVTFHREVAPWGLDGVKALPVGEFGHIAATYDGAEMKIYVGGKLDVKQDRGAQNTDLATPVLIGARFTQGKPSEFFRGALDEVALFNVALDENQIQEVMRGLSANKAVSAYGKLAYKWGSIKRKE